MRPIVATRDTAGRLTFEPAVPRPAFKWTDTLDARLRILAPDYTAASIGIMIGVSRNAVIGRCRRKGIELGKGAPAPVRRSPVSPKSPAPALPTSPAPVFGVQKFHAFGGESDRTKVEAISRQRLTLQEYAAAKPTPAWQPKRVGFFDIRNGLCRWPLWSSTTPFSEKFFCGLPTDGGVYCAHCSERGTSPKATAWLDNRLGISKARAAA
ncbi:hypothetical protein ASE63_22305 [Bosea sp. Root381]|uniref:GcrA family cell cycle regulator n=1 Tax=Bosea sp. Root381 TaxID=1736524 RepID=UPI0006F820A6|nr:GcrA family cell cycle regulator [Bosea sp. Root381]KRE07434.1 hypothetical protein ASE63_22305 [Bosea sp. Root381]